MTKIVLIHGYGYKIKVKNIMINNMISTEFEGFNRLLNDGRCVLFDWSTSRLLGIHEVSNPLKQIEIYQQDKKSATSSIVQDSLTNYLIEHAPSVIVAHSLGSYVLMNQVYCSNLPRSVRHVVFVQADIPYVYASTETDFYHRVRNKQIFWHNFYCLWDNALYASFFINRYIPKGLFGSKNKYIRNYFFPLNHGPNFHTSSIRDIRFSNKVMELDR